MAIFFLLFVFASIGVSTAQAQETEKDYKLLWSYETGNILEDISVSTDGSYIAAGSRDNKVYFFNLNGELLWSYKTGGSVWGVSVSSDGSYIAAGSYDYNVYLFNQEGKLLWKYKTDGVVRDVSVSSDGSYIAAGSGEEMGITGLYYGNNNVYLFNREGELLWSYKTDSEVGGVSISSDSLYIAAGSGDYKVYFFNLNGKLLWNYKTDSTVYGVSVSSDGSYIAAGSCDYKAYFFNRKGELLWSYKTDSDVSSVSISSDGSYIAAGSGYDKIYLFNRERKVLWSYSYQPTYKKTTRVEGVSISSDGSYIAAVFCSGKVCFFITLERLAKDNIEKAKMAVDSEGGKGFNIAEAETLLSQAEQAFKAGDYTQANYFADQAKAKAEAIGREAIEAKSTIHKAMSAISQEKSKGFILTEADSLFSQSEKVFNAGDYNKVKELADESYSLAIDIDQDEVINENDFAPTIKNNYIYAGGVVLTAVFTGAGFVFSRNRKKRKEYQAKVREYRAKMEQWKSEGYDVSGLEEMMK